MSDTECCICLDDLYCNKSLFISECGHSFHFECICEARKSGLKWNCPLCRKMW